MGDCCSSIDDGGLWLAIVWFPFLLVLRTSVNLKVAYLAVLPLIDDF